MSKDNSEVTALSAEVAARIAHQQASEAKKLDRSSKFFAQEFIGEMQILHIKKGDLVYIRPKEPLDDEDLMVVKKSLASIQELVGIQIWYDNKGSFNISVMRKEPTDAPETRK